MPTVPVITTLLNGRRRARVIRARSLRPGDVLMAPRSPDRRVARVGVYPDGRVLAQYGSRPGDALDGRTLSGNSLVFIAPRSADA